MIHVLIERMGENCWTIGLAYHMAFDFGTNKSKHGNDKLHTCTVTIHVCTIGEVFCENSSTLLHGLVGK